MLRFLFLFLAIFVGACDLGGAALSESSDVSTAVSSLQKENYLLQIGDRVQVKIYPEDEYLKGGEMEISADGNITLPLLGKVNIAGKNVLEAQRHIAELLEKDYLVNPEVVIEVLEYRKQTFVVLGQVRKPGTYEIPPGARSLTLLEAISMAGGFSEIANIKKIKVMRKGEGRTEVIHANAEAIIRGEEPDIELKDGDIIHVAESLF